MKKNIVALTIAGSDSGGGAGIQADLKTFSSLGVYGTTVITTITAQNLKKIIDIFVLPVDIIHKQLETVLSGYPVKAAKTGILYSEQIIDTVVISLKEKIKKDQIKLIIDPVMISTSGRTVLEKKALEKMQSDLFPIAALITPNIPEAEFLSEKKISSVEDMKKVAITLYEKYKIPFLLKGGHLPDKSNDILITKDGITSFNSEKITGINTHGSGCTLSAAITAFLAQNYNLIDAVTSAKAYMRSILLDPLQISEETQIINHFSNY